MRFLKTTMQGTLCLAFPLTQQSIDRFGGFSECEWSLAQIGLETPGVSGPGVIAYDNGGKFAAFTITKGANTPTVAEDLSARIRTKVLVVGRR